MPKENITRLSVIVLLLSLCAASSAQISLKRFIAFGQASSVITLSGSPGAPNVITKGSGSPGTTATWAFDTDGDVTSDGGAFNDGTEWSSIELPADATPKWIRATSSAGSNPTSGTLNAWLQVAGSGGSARTWSWTSSDGNNITGSIKVEIAADSGGSNVLATGYYGANVN